MKLRYIIVASLREKFILVLWFESTYISHIIYKYQTYSKTKFGLFGYFIELISPRVDLA